MSKICLPDDAKTHQLAENLIGNVKDPFTRLENLMPFIVDKFQERDGVEFSYTKDVRDNILTRLEEDIDYSKSIIEPIIKAYNKLKTTDFTKIKAVVTDRFTNPERYEKMIRSRQYVDHQIGDDTETLYRDFQLQELMRIYEGTLSKENAEKLGYVNYNKQADTSTQAINEVIFTESTGDYPQRTKENAEWSDITLDFTENDKGSGGLNELTKRVAGRKYVHFKLHDSVETAYDADEILSLIQKAGLPTKNIKLNIAGSEVGKLKYDQETYNQEIKRILEGLQSLGVTIAEVRSGGQTGIDEAGIIAAQRLGIPASIHAPKGWKFRGKNGRDTYNEESFKARFNPQKQQTPSQKVSVSREQLTKNLKSKLSKEIDVGRSGYVSVTISTENYNNAPIITISSYNSASDMSVERQYRLSIDGNIEERVALWGNELEDNWKLANSPYKAIVEFFNTSSQIQFKEENNKTLQTQSESDTTTTTESAKRGTTTSLDLGDEFSMERIQEQLAKEGKTIPVTRERTSIVWDTEFADKPLSIQLDDVKYQLSPQDKSSAIDIIADSIYNIINTSLQKSNQKLAEAAKERGITLAALKVQQEDRNKEILRSIEIEQSFKNPNAKAIQRLLGSFVPLTELDVIKAYGIRNIINITKKDIQSLPKADLISTNFDALLREAASKLNNLYGINILGNTELFDDDDDSSENSNDQSNTEHNSEGSKEDFTHADDKSRASIRNLTKDLKLAYRRCFITNSKGQVLLNGFGKKTPVDHQAAHNKVLHLLEGMIDVNDVIPLLKKSQEGWMKQFVTILQQDPRLINQLYWCCKLSAQDYRIVTKKDGQFIQMSLNKLAGRELVQNEVTANVVNGLIQTTLNKSIYDTQGKINPQGVKYVIDLITELSNNIAMNGYQNVESLDKDLRQIFKSIGISIPDTFDTNESIALFNAEKPQDGLIAVLTGIKNFCDKLSKNPEGIINTSDNYLNSAYLFIGKSAVGYVESSVTEEGKTYYTYAKTNYTDELLLHLKKSVPNKKTKEGKDYYEDFQQKQFGQSTFFRNPKTKAWYSEWMSKLFDNSSKGDVYRDMISRCSVLYTTVDGQKTEFVKWSDVESMVTNYTMYKQATFNTRGKTLEPNEKAAWYRMPIASDSNASDYIQFVKYVDNTEKSYEEILMPLFWNICKQELVRISEVNEHLKQEIFGQNPSASIKGYDAKQKDGIITDAGGLVFTLLPQLNYVKVDTNNHAIFQKIPASVVDKCQGRSFRDVLLAISNRRNRDAWKITEDDLQKFFIEVFKERAERDFNEEWDQVESTIGSQEKYQYREFYYNYMYAWIQMVELTSTDLAFFGKRKVKEVNSTKEADFTHSLDVVENGQPKVVLHYYKIVSDDTLTNFQKRNKEQHAPTNKVALQKPYFKEVYLDDIETTSAIINNVISIVNNNPNLSRVAKDRIIRNYQKKVTVGDGQSYRSLESYLEILSSMGTLTEEQREAFQRVIHTHKWDEGDLNLIALALKPYFYAPIPKVRSTTDKNGNKNVVLTPTQHKNSELPLTAALGAISASLNNSEVLKGMNQFMSDNGVDVIHFTSVVKVGETGTISSDFDNMTAKEIADKLTDNCGFNESMDGDPDIVQQVPTAFWGIQLSKPEHLVDARQLIGSQIRRALLVDFPDDSNYTIEVNGKKIKASEFKKHYQDLISASIIEDFSSVDETFKDPRKLEAFLQESIASSTKYDSDLIEMFTWDSATKRFKIPFWNRTVYNRVEEILLALMKNRIAKQKIAGGAAVQTAAVGLSKELNVRYQKDGKILDTWDEFNKKNPSATKDDFEEYIKDATLAYMEVYLPMWSRDMIEALTDEQGNLHYEKLPEELKYMVGYRIPTEDHYSCAPLKVVGFLPNLNASTVVLPAEVTQIAGSDYDIDVLYIMRHEFKVNKYNEEALKADYQTAKDKYIEKQKDEVIDNLLSDIFGISKENLTPEFINYQRWRNQHLLDTDKNGNRKYLLPKDKWTLEKIKYNKSLSEAENSKKARNNEFIDCCIGVLQSPHSLQKFTDLGNYDELKVASRICEILFSPNNTKSLTTLRSLSLEQLDEIVLELNKDKNPASPKTQTDLHQQNMAGNQLKGIFVAAKALQEVLEYAPIKITRGFTINGNESAKKDTDFILGKKRTRNGTLITKRFASWVAAAVDNGKDPLMNALKVNPENANIANYLTMVGYEPLEIAVFLNCYNALSNISISPEEASELYEKYDKLYDYNALSLDMMIWGTQNSTNIADERIRALSLYVKSTYRTIERQSKHIMQLAKGLRSDSMKFEKSVIENLEQVFAIEDFISYLDSDEAEHEPVNGLPILPPTINTQVTDNSINRRKDKANLSYLQTFTDALLSAHTMWLNPYMLYTKDGILPILKVMHKKLSKTKFTKFVNSFFDAYQRMVVLNLPVFGPDDKLTLSEKREYLRYDFPEEFSKFKRNLPKELENNSFIDNIICAGSNTFDDHIHLEVKDLGKNKDVRAKFKTDFDVLASYNPDMAMKLFVYTVFRNGFGYSQTGWAHLTSMNFQQSIPNYIETIEGMSQVDIQSMNSLLLQVLGNNIESYEKFFEEITDKIDITTTIPEDFNPDEIQFVTNDNGYFVSFDGGATMLQVPMLGSGKFYHEYFRTSDVINSVFKFTDRKVEEELKDDDLPPEAYKVSESKQVSENTESKEKQVATEIPKAEQKGDDGKPSC